MGTRGTLTDTGRAGERREHPARCHEDDEFLLVVEEFGKGVGASGFGGVGDGGSCRECARSAICHAGGAVAIGFNLRGIDIRGMVIMTGGMPYRSRNLPQAFSPRLLRR